MREVSLEDRKQLQLKILEAVNLFCQNNNITYFLCGGTLLGAIRHKGYIPWDDDIDIGMPRADYERFLNIFDHEKLKVYTYDKNENYEFPFAKVSCTDTILKEALYNNFLEIGIHIDLFPFDKAPSNLETAYTTVGSLDQQRDLLGGYVFDQFNTINKSYKYENNIVGTFKKLKHDLKVRFVGKNYFKDKIHTCLSNIDTISQQYNLQDSEYIGCLVWGYGRKEIFKTAVFSEFINAAFEGLSLPIISNYSIYLTQLYGDYMQLPKESDRVIKHSLKAFYKE